MADEVQLFCTIIKKRIQRTRGKHLRLDPDFPHPNDLDRLLRELEFIRSTLHLPSSPVPYPATHEELRAYLSIEDGASMSQSRGFMEDLSSSIPPSTAPSCDDSQHTTISTIHYFIIIVLLLLCIFLFINRFLIIAITISLIILFSILYCRRSKKKRNSIYIKKDDDDLLIKYLDLDNQYYQVSTPHDADIIIDNGLEMGTERHRHEVQAILDEYRKIDKPVMMLWITDCNDSYDVPANVIFYKTSLYKSLSDPNEETLAYVWESMDHASPLPSSDRPIVGFCGAAWPNRKPLLDSLDAHPDIETRFIRRDHFWGGNPHDETIVKEFRDNMANAHFTVCNRGAGNFTMRFYQALSMGRIPLLIDTDMKFPYEDRIDWDAIIVRGRTVEQVIDHLLLFWKTHDVEKTQDLCYQTYQQFFKPDIYFNHLVRETMRNCPRSS